MSDLDTLAPNYQRAVNRWPDASTIVKCYNALERCIDSNSHGSVEYIKSFIETVCLTITIENDQPIERTDSSTTQMLVSALRAVGIENSRGASKLDKVLSAFNKLTDALSEMRNENGAVAHGKDGYLEAITADHARAFLHTGDAILGLLLSAYEGKEPDIIRTRDPYDRFSHMNRRIDQAVRLGFIPNEDGDESTITFSVSTGTAGEEFELRVQASRLLFGVDRNAYVAAWKAASGGISAGALSSDDDTLISIPQLINARISNDFLYDRSGYNGQLDNLIPQLSGFVESRFSLSTPKRDELVATLLPLLYQNMGLDWGGSEQAKARLRSLSRRQFAKVGVSGAKAEQSSTDLVDMLTSLYFAGKASEQHG